jgi:hypothetical protein
MKEDFNTLNIPEKVIFFFQYLNSYLSFWVFGPTGISKLLIRFKKALINLDSVLYFPRIGNSFGAVSSFSCALSGGLKWFFCEIFITGKGFRFERVRRAGKLGGFRLYMGLRCVFRFLLPRDSILIGINKRKLIITSKNIQQLNNFAQKIQQLKPPAKFYRQGINLKFRVKKLQNFRHKKRQ